MSINQIEELKHILQVLNISNEHFSENYQIDQYFLKKHYHQLIKRKHPDHGGNSHEFIEIKRCYEKLSTNLEEYRMILPYLVHSYDDNPRSESLFRELIKDFFLNYVDEEIDIDFCFENLCNYVDKNNELNNSYERNSTHKKTIIFTHIVKYLQNKVQTSPNFPKYKIFENVNSFVNSFYEQYVSDNNKKSKHRQLEPNIYLKVETTRYHQLKEKILEIEYNRFVKTNNIVDKIIVNLSRDIDYDMEEIVIPKAGNIVPITESECCYPSYDGSETNFCIGDLILDIQID